jgi:SAM-dependent methyltransferase
MNRKERRAAVARGTTAAGPLPPGTATLIAEATQAFGAGQTLRAEAICQRILAQAPAHAPSLNLLGLISQASGRDRPAIKMFAKAIAANDQDAACHYNIGLSYQRVNERAAAAAHFKKAIDLGLSGKAVDGLLLQNPEIVDGIKRVAARTGAAPVNSDPSDEPEIAKIAKDVFLQCALQSILICSLPIECLLTHLRRALLRRAHAAAFDRLPVEHDALALFCALAQQCFIGEYVFAQSDDETALLNRLCDVLPQLLSAGRAVPPVLLAGIGAYLPLHALPGAQSLLTKSWPKCVDDLLHQQVRGPLKEAEELRAIPALTAIDDAVSISVMEQYEESPYPRWATNPLAAPRRNERPSEVQRYPLVCPEEILVAGCGTGQHAFYVAQQTPQARILAVDLSRTSLAYARRKTRDAGLGNIEYAQADILKLATIGRTFDRIEAMGVLHHLAEPKAGLRALLSLLRPGGIIRLGLYSEAARSVIVRARALISERGYAATPWGIRALRQAMISDPGRWSHILATSADFHSMSGCRDLLFNVMEHKFTIPQLAALLDESDLCFLGFELDPVAVQRFQQQYPDARAMTNLDDWHAFEIANPDTFSRMYVFSARKGERSASTS